MRKTMSLVLAMLFTASTTAAFADTRTSDTTNPNTPPQQSVDKLHQKPDDTSSNARDADGSTASASHKDNLKLRQKANKESKGMQSNPGTNSNY